MSLLDALLLDPYRINTWIAYRTDGVKGTGTQNDPWDGSTATKFNDLMNSFSANTCVHVGPGPFETNGYADSVGGGWQPKAGMRIVGSGIDVTTLKLVGGTTASKHYFAIGQLRRSECMQGTVNNFRKIPVDRLGGGVLYFRNTR